MLRNQTKLMKNTTQESKFHVSYKSQFFVDYKCLASLANVKVNMKKLIILSLIIMASRLNAQVPNVIPFVSVTDTNFIQSISKFSDEMINFGEFQFFHICVQEDRDSLVVYVYPSSNMFINSEIIPFSYFICENKLAFLYARVSGEFIDYNLSFKSDLLKIIQNYEKDSTYTIEYFETTFSTDDFPVLKYFRRKSEHSTQISYSFRPPCFKARRKKK